MTAAGRSARRRQFLNRTFSKRETREPSPMRMSYASRPRRMQFSIRMFFSPNGLLLLDCDVVVLGE